MMRTKPLMLLIALAGLVYSNAARADCFNPAATEGKIIYNSSHNVLQYCDGTDWMAVGSARTAPCGFDDNAVCPAANSSLQGCLSKHALGWAATSCTDFGGYFQIQFSTPTVNGSRASGNDSASVAEAGHLFCNELGLAYNTNTNASTAGAYARSTSSLGDGEPWSFGSTTDQKINTLNCTTKLCHNIGDVCPDGSVYAGISLDNGTSRMFVTPADAPSAMWDNNNADSDIGGLTNCSVAPPAGSVACRTGESYTTTLAGLSYAAAQYCDTLVAHGQNDWYLPSQDELYTLYTNRASIGGFTTSGALPAAAYWSVSENTAANGRVLDFAAGSATAANRAKSEVNRVRCVRKN